MKMSPGSICEPNLAKSVSIAYGTEPMCSGMVTLWAIICPCVSHREVEKSSVSRTIVE